MATSKQIPDLVINKLENRLIYDYMKNNGLLNEDEVYLIEGDGGSVLYTVQSLTEEQKAQARINIDALGVSDIGNIDLTNYYTKTEIDNLELITVEDIDTICGATIQSASEVMF